MHTCSVGRSSTLQLQAALRQPVVGGHTALAVDGCQQSHFLVMQLHCDGWRLKVEAVHAEALPANHLDRVVAWVGFENGLGQRNGVISQSF